jgi:protein-tyrosine-phosphatase
MSFIAPDTGTAPLTILFLSRRGSARAIMAAALTRRVGGGRFRGFPAAVHPVPERDPETIALLGTLGYPIEEVPVPRHFGEVLAGPDGQSLDFVFTLSDTAANEAPPEWPGHPVTAHWACVDPVIVAGKSAERGLAYLNAYAALERRLKIFFALPFAELTRMTLQAKVKAIAAAA